MAMAKKSEPPEATGLRKHDRSMIEEDDLSSSDQDTASAYNVKARHRSPMKRGGAATDRQLCKFSTNTAEDSLQGPEQLVLDDDSEYDDDLRKYDRSMIEEDDLPSSEQDPASAYNVKARHRSPMRRGGVAADRQLRGCRFHFPRLLPKIEGGTEAMLGVDQDTASAYDVKARRRSPMERGGAATDHQLPGVRSDSPVENKERAEEKTSVENKERAEEPHCRRAPP